MNRYDLIAKFYDKLLEPVEKNVILPLRKRFVPMIKGYTLDLSVGTGNNVFFYPPGSDVVLIDKSKKMLEIAQKKAEKRKDIKAEFVLAEIENLPFDDETFDTVLSIDVFCSVKDPIKSMKEVKRVLKSNGVVIFVEHGLTGNWKTDLFLFLTNFITYPTVGSSMIRKPFEYIKRVGFKIIEHEKLQGSFQYILAKK